MTVTIPSPPDLHDAERRLLAARLTFREAAAAHDLARAELIDADRSVRRLQAPGAEPARGEPGRTSAP